MGGERKYRHVSASLSLTLSLFLFSPPASLHPAFHKLCTPIYTQLRLNDSNAMCLSSIEKGRESSSLRGPELLCTFISMQCSGGIDRWRHMPEIDVMLLIAGYYDTLFSFPLSFFFYHASRVSYLEICKEMIHFNLYFSGGYSNNLNIPFMQRSPDVICL